MREAFPAARADFRPDITVACVIERDGRFLLVEEQVRGQRVLNQPAGHVEAGETLQQAAVREALEETRWQVRLLGLVGVYQWQAPDATHFLRFAFRAEALREEPERSLDRGILRPLWLNRRELLEHESDMRSPLVLRAIDDALRGGHAPLELLHAVG